MKLDYEVIILGAGVIGLAVAQSLAERNLDSVLIIEKDDSFGRGISGRNSEVIHSGIYYPRDSLKTQFCIRGRNLLYAYCKKHSIFHKECGKIIIAQKNQENDLSILYELGQSKNMDDLELLSKKEISKLEPDIDGALGLFVGSTGIVDSHGLMNAFYQSALEKGHDFLFKSNVLNCEQVEQGFRITAQTPSPKLENVTSKWVVNATGLNSDIISNMIIPDDQTPKLKYSKGYYFSLSSRWRNRFSHLVYPLPDKYHKSLGVHLSFDQTGSVKLGPDAHYLDENVENYQVDSSLSPVFYKEASKYITDLVPEDLTPDFSGIRPKIKTDEPMFTDFYLSHEEKLGYPGWVNCIGIDSPGLTSALAIGKKVTDWILL